MPEPERHDLSAFDLSRHTIGMSDGELSELAEAAEGLEGIPGLGPARRASLLAAGIATRADLRRATVEQMIGVTGMPRILAEKTLALLREGPSTPEERAAEPPLPPPTDETLPDSDGETSSVEESEPNAPEPEPPADLDRAILMAKTALSDASRTLPKTKGYLPQHLQKLADLLESLPERASEIGEKRQERLVKSLKRLTQRLERAASRTEDWTRARADRLSDRLAELRAEIRETIDEQPKQNKPKQRRKKK